MNFQYWWERHIQTVAGLSVEATALAAWDAAKAQSGNYVSDDDPVEARAVTFANGRTVKVIPDGYLVVGWVSAPQKAT